MSVKPVKQGCLSLLGVPTVGKIVFPSVIFSKLLGDFASDVVPKNLQFLLHSPPIKICLFADCGLRIADCGLRIADGTTWAPTSENHISYAFCCK